MVSELINRAHRAPIGVGMVKWFACGLAAFSQYTGYSDEVVAIYISLFILLHQLEILLPHYPKQ